MRDVGADAGADGGYDCEWYGNDVFGDECGLAGLAEREEGETDLRFHGIGGVEEGVKGSGASTRSFSLFIFSAKRLFLILVSRRRCFDGWYSCALKFIRSLFILSLKSYTCLSYLYISFSPKALLNNTFVQTFGFDAYHSTELRWSFWESLRSRSR